MRPDEPIAPRHGSSLFEVSIKGGGVDANANPAAVLGCRSSWSSVLGRLTLPCQAEPLHTFDGKHSIETIDLKRRLPLSPRRTAPPCPTGAVPRGLLHEADRGVPSPARPTAGRSLPHPGSGPSRSRSEKNADDYRGGDANKTFLPPSVNEAREAAPAGRATESARGIRSSSSSATSTGARPSTTSAGPASSTASATHEGNIAGDGPPLPRAESGGARATYQAREGRARTSSAPTAGACRIAAPIASSITRASATRRPAPPRAGRRLGDEPGAVPRGINEAWIDTDQKKALGWEAPGPHEPDADPVHRVHGPAPARRTSHREGGDAALTWPPGAKAKTLAVAVQTGCPAPGRIGRSCPAGPPSACRSGRSTRRRRSATASGRRWRTDQSAEVRGYFQVR